MQEGLSPRFIEISGLKALLQLSDESYTQKKARPKPGFELPIRKADQ